MAFAIRGMSLVNKALLLVYSVHKSPSLKKGFYNSKTSLITTHSSVSGFNDLKQETKHYTDCDVEHHKKTVEDIKPQ